MAVGCWPVRPLVRLLFRCCQVVGPVISVVRHHSAVSVQPGHCWSTTTLVVGMWPPLFDRRLGSVTVWPVWPTPSLSFLPAICLVALRLLLCCRLVCRHLRITVLAAVWLCLFGSFRLCRLSLFCLPVSVAHKTLELHLFKIPKTGT